ncbi:hypothetical protein ACI4BE_30210, partial [Klebsiella pneumoniae]|uniref:hypothetical protein n=1 Tax=Klebsiella pneumoniae TaxID=573 RepID=UPI003853BC94
MEIIIGVGYNSDLRLVENILNNVLLKIEGIEKHPAPIVLAHNFSESSVDFRLLFWSDMDAWIKV